MNHRNLSMASFTAIILCLTLPASAQSPDTAKPDSGTGQAAMQESKPPAGTGKDTAKPEEKKEEEDEGPSKFEFYMLGHGGYEYFNLMALHADPSFVNSSEAEFTGNGGCVGAGLGLRFLFISIGLDYQYAMVNLSGKTTDAFNHVTHSSGDLDLHTLMLELDLILPLSVVDIMLQAMFGYARASTSLDIGEAFDSDGLAGRVGLALDIYLVKWLSLGVGGDVGFLYFYKGNATAGSLAVDAQARLVFHIY